MTHRLLSSCLLLMMAALPLHAQRITTLLNDSWRFALGDASSMQRDYGHGTEYFTYMSKAASADNNRGPAWQKFDDSSWQTVTLPHDWAVDLPFSSEASHSHGYKQIGWRYPQNSIGWYRRHLTVPKEWDGRRVEITFDGIYRNSQVFCNGFYLGGEPSGYATQSYDLSDYLDYGADNVITVRADASVEEGWYYEGAGIYRDVWLTSTPKTHIEKAFIAADAGETAMQGMLNVRVALGGDCSNMGLRVTLYDADGHRAARPTTYPVINGQKEVKSTIMVPKIESWSAANPILYNVKLELLSQPNGGDVVDVVERKTGFTHYEFTAETGFTNVGQSEKFRGFDLHLDHAGVGVGVPDSLWCYIIGRLKAMGANAIRCSHNPATPAMLRACDSLGMYVIDENRLMGTTADYHRLLTAMIERDQYHPSVVLWSIGNEEWGIETGSRGERMARRMSNWAHTADPFRNTTYGNSGGYGVVKEVDVHGYNYIFQNDVDNRHREHPDWVVIGTEETSGCGTRGVYRTDSVRGVMQSINTYGEERSGGLKNVIERGWHFYRDNPWAAGIFYWTGFDYRGEPNPMKWPSTGSEFGILDYCGFPKDEAYYLKAAWTDEPVLHIFPGSGNEVWAYTNCPEVELFENGTSLGRKQADRDSHVVWTVTDGSSTITAKGYGFQSAADKALAAEGKAPAADPNTVSATAQTASKKPATAVKAVKSKPSLSGNPQDAMVIDITLTDADGRTAATACNNVSVTIPAGVRVLGWGNGDPAWKVQERPAKESFAGGTITIPAFNGHAQVIITSDRPYDGTPACKL